MSDLTYILIIAVLCLLLYAVIYKAMGLKKENAKLEKLVADYRQSLSEYMTELALIRSDGATVQKEIQNAETEEEVLDILGNIISRNNNRVQNNKTKK